MIPNTNKQFNSFHIRSVDMIDTQTRYWWVVSHDHYYTTFQHYPPSVYTMEYNIDYWRYVMGLHCINIGAFGGMWWVCDGLALYTNIGDRYTMYVAGLYYIVSIPINIGAFGGRKLVSVVGWHCNMYINYYYQLKITVAF